MKNQADYSLYKCPYSHIEKDCGHELIGPEGHEDTYGIWCACGFRGPVFCLSPENLRLEKKHKEPEINKCCVCGTTDNLHKDGWHGYRCNSHHCVCF